jgi:hypothetical protein
MMLNLLGSAIPSRLGFGYRSISIFSFVRLVLSRIRSKISIEETID